MNAQPGHYRTPLHFAAIAEETEMVELPLKNGAALDRKDSGGSTALHLALEAPRRNGSQATAQFLLDHGASTQITNGGGETALHVAVDREAEEIVENWDMTPHVAASKKRCGKIVQLLLENGADPALFDHFGNTARMMAEPKESSGRSSIVRQRPHYHDCGSSAPSSPG